MEPFLGELRIFSWAWPPKGWLPCDGRVLPIQQYQALAALMGAVYGGDGKTTFALPDLRGRVPVHIGVSSSNVAYLQGKAAGSETIQLTANQIPPHNHGVSADSNPGTAILATANFMAPPAPPPAAPSTVPPFLFIPPASAGTLAPLDPTAMKTAGGGAGHENRQPYLTMNYCIAWQGIWPSRQ